MPTCRILTVQILLEDVIDTDDGACDFISNMLSDNTLVKDWSYTKARDGSWNYPKPVSIEDNYNEGDAFWEDV